MCRTATLLFLVALGFLSDATARADKLVLVAGGTKEDGSPATDAKLTGPFAVDFDKAGNTYISEMLGLRIRKIDAKTGILTTLAGTGEKGKGGDDGPAAKAQFDAPHHLAVGPNGDVYIADTDNHRVRKIDAKTGVITTIAGTGEKGFSGDGGPATKAKFGGIYCLAFDAKREKIYLADLDNRRIRVVDLNSGTVATVATATAATSRRAPEHGADAKSARHSTWIREAVAVDAVGTSTSSNVVATAVAARRGRRQRRVRTVAGTGKAGDRRRRLLGQGPRTRWPRSTCASTPTATCSLPTPRTT